MIEMNSMPKWYAMNRFEYNICINRHCSHTDFVFELTSVWVYSYEYAWSDVLWVGFWLCDGIEFTFHFSSLNFVYYASIFSFDKIDAVLFYHFNYKLQHYTQHTLWYAQQYLCVSEHTWRFFFRNECKISAKIIFDADSAFYSSSEQTFYFKLCPCEYIVIPESDYHFWIFSFHFVYEFSFILF